RMMHRSSIMISGESAASYALVKLILAGESGNKPLGLNLALVIDVSGSMHEYDGTDCKRIERVQQAAAKAIAKLKPDDRLAVVAFGHDAKVLLPSTLLADRAAVERVIQDIESAGVDPGGTAMDQGIRLALAEVGKNLASGWLSQVVILTDGETSSEQVCRQLAQQAAEQRIHLSVMGVGTEWNANLLKDL